MTAVADDDLLEDDFFAPKGNAKPLVRTQKQMEAAARKKAADDLAAQNSAAKAAAARVAQVVNLTIAGFSFEDIGAAIGASVDEVEQMLLKDSARFVRTQPALRSWVRNYISGKYTNLLDAVWDEAVNKNSKQQLEHQDRALRILDRMARLHGAEAPTQSEVKVEAAPEAVDRLVARLAAGQGLDYNTSIFDVVPGEVVHRAVIEAAEAERVSGNAVGDESPDDEPL